MIKLSDNVRIKNSQNALRKGRELAEKLPWKFKNMTKQQVINELKKSREELWNEKFKTRPGHK